MHGQMGLDWQTAAAWVCIEATVIMNKGDIWVHHSEHRLRHLRLCGS